MSDTQRLRALEDEKGKLKRLLADGMFDKAALNDLPSTGSAAMRQAVAYLKAAFGFSERGACSIIKAERKSMRYRSCRPPGKALRERLRALATERRRFCYAMRRWTGPTP